MATGGGDTGVAWVRTWACFQTVEALEHERDSSIHSLGALSLPTERGKTCCLESASQLTLQDLARAFADRSLDGLWRPGLDVCMPECQRREQAGSLQSIYRSAGVSSHAACPLPIMTGPGPHNWCQSEVPLW